MPDIFTPSTPPLSGIVRVKNGVTPKKPEHFLSEKTPENTALNVKQFFVHIHGGGYGEESRIKVYGNIKIKIVNNVHKVYLWNIKAL